MEILAVIAFTIVFYLVLPIALLVARDRWESRRQLRKSERLRRESPELCAGTPQYEARFHHPDFAALEAHVGGPIPASLKELFLQPDIVPEREFVILVPKENQEADGIWQEEIHIGGFWPADAIAVQQGDWTLDFIDTAYLPFSTDGGEGVYLLALNESNEDDGPVYCYVLDGGDQYKIAHSLRQMLSWPRISADQWLEDLETR